MDKRIIHLVWGIMCSLRFCSSHYSYTNSVGARASACAPRSFHRHASPKPQPLGCGWFYRGLLGAFFADSPTPFWLPGRNDNSIKRCFFWESFNQRCDNQWDTPTCCSKARHSTLFEGDELQGDVLLEGLFNNLEYNCRQFLCVRLSLPQLCST